MGADSPITGKPSTSTRSPISRGAACWVSTRSPLPWLSRKIALACCWYATMPRTRTRCRETSPATNCGPQPQHEQCLALAPIDCLAARLRVPRKERVLLWVRLLFPGHVTFARELQAQICLAQSLPRLPRIDRASADTSARHSPL